MELALVLILVAAVAAFVAAPLRPGRAQAAEQAASAARAELEAARDAKYREIRDAELDFGTGKLSDGEWREQDRALKQQAMELLRRLDELDDREAATVGARPAGQAQPRL